MVRYSVPVRDQIFVKYYGLLPFHKNMRKSTCKNLTSKYNQKLLDYAKQSATDALKTASKRDIKRIL